MTSPCTPQDTKSRREIVLARLRELAARYAYLAREVELVGVMLKHSQTSVSEAERYIVSAGGDDEELQDEL